MTGVQTCALPILSGNQRTAREKSVIFLVDELAAYLAFLSDGTIQTLMTVSGRCEKPECKKIDRKFMQVDDLSFVMANDSST